MATTNDTVYVEIIAKTSQAVNGIMNFAKAFAASYVSIKAFQQLVVGSVQEYLKSEAAAKKLSSAMLGLGNTSKVSLNSMKDLSSALQKTTQYADDVTQSAMAMLMSVGGMTSRMASDMTPAVQDFASAMGMDLESAATLVAKAVEGNVGALSRYGIKIQEGLDKNGRMAALTDELQKKFGGLAKAMGDTASGALARLTNAFSDMKEEIGRATMTQLRPLVDWLTKVASGIASVMEAANDLREALRAETLGIADTNDKLIIASSKYAETSKKIKEIQAGITDAATYQKYYNEAISAGATSIDEYLVMLQKRAIEERRALNNTEGVARREKDAAEAAEKIAQKQREFLEKLATAYAKTPEAQKKALEIDISYWESTLKNAGASADQIIAILAMLRQQYDETYGVISKPRGMMWQGAIAPAGIVRAEKEFGGGEDYGPSAEDMEELLAGIESSRQSTKEWAEYWIEVNKQAELTNENLAETEALQKKYEKLFGSVVGMAETLAESISDGDVVGGLRAIAQQLADMLAKYAITAAASAAATMNWGLMAFWLGVAGVSVMAGASMGGAGGGGGGLPRMASGGVVTRPTLALIGEAGPEAVVPLGKGMGGGVTINVQGNIWQTEDLARAVAGAMGRW